MNRKAIHTCLALFITSILCAQSFEIRAVVVDPTTVGVEMRETSGTNTPSTSDFLFDMVFGLKWDNSTDNDLGSIDNSSGYSIIKSGVENVNGSDEFQAFAFNGTIPFNFPESWTTGTWTQICQINSGNGNFTGTIEICPLGFDSSTEPNIGISFNMGPILDFAPEINGVAIFTSLPAELGKFEVFRENGQAVLLWATLSEINVSHFEIEKSTDGLNWSYIGEERAVGNSTVPSSYSFQDEEISFLAHQTFYYRLKIVDVDGTFEYSDVRSLRVEPIIIHALTIFPNPAQKDVIIELDKAHAFNQLKVLDLAGRLLDWRNIAGITSITLDVDALALTKGVYILHFESPSGTMVSKRLFVD